MINNNYVVQVPKDLKRVESKLFFGLTKRQLIGFGFAAILGFIVFFLLKGINLNTALYGLFIVAAPIIFITIYHKDGLYAEKWFKLYLEYKFLNPSKRTYKVTKRNFMLAKERKVMLRASSKKIRKPTGTEKPVSSAATPAQQ